MGCSWTHFGAHFGAQNGGVGGTCFSSFFGKIKTSLETFVFFMLPRFHDFTEKLPKHIKNTHTHGSTKKTNVSSEVLILPNTLKNQDLARNIRLFHAPEPPSGPILGSSWLQESPERAQKSSERAPRASKIAPREHKSASREPQESPRGPKRAQESVQ